MKKRISNCVLGVGVACAVLATPLLSLSFLKSIQSNTTQNNIYNNITMYTTNDIHGRLLRNDSENVVGLNAISGYLNTNNVDLLMDAGDLTQGTAINDLDYGQTAIEILKLMNYDVLGIGNHEFDFGLDQLKANVELAPELFLSANIKDKTTEEQLFNGSKIIHLDQYNLNIGVIGLTTPDTVTQTKADSVKDVIFTDYIQTTKEEIAKLKQQDSNLNFIIVVAHSGFSYSEKLAQDPDLAKEIDIIIDGHTHETYYKRIGNTHIIQAGSYTEGLRKTVFDFNSQTGIIERFRSDMINPVILNQYEIYASEEIKQLIQIAENKMNEVYGEVVLEDLPYTLEGSRENIRSKETNLGNFIADALYEGAKQELNNETPISLALLNSGGIRTSINSGSVTKMDIYNAVPNQNLLSIVSCPGSVLKQVLSANKSIVNGTTVFQVSSQVQMDVIAANNYSIKIWSPETNAYEEIVDDKEYVVATIDFITTSLTGTYSLLNPLVTENVKSLGTFSNSTDYIEEYMKNITDWNLYKDPLPNSRTIYHGSIISADVITNSPYKLYFPINGSVYTEENGSNLLIDSYAFTAKELDSEVQAAIIYNSAFRNYNSNTYPYLEGDITQEKIQKVISSYATSNYLTIVKIPGLALIQMLTNDLQNKLQNKSIIYHYSQDIKAILNEDNTMSFYIKADNNYVEIQENQIYTIATNDYSTKMTSINYHYLNPTKWEEVNLEWCNNNPDVKPEIKNEYKNYVDILCFTKMLSTFTSEDQWLPYINRYPNERLVINIKEELN